MKSTEGKEGDMETMGSANLKPANLPLRGTLTLDDSLFSCPKGCTLRYREQLTNHS